MENQTINSEQAFDLLPFVVDIFEKLDFNKYRKDLQGKYKGKKVDPIEVATEASLYILKNSGKVKKEFFSIVSIVEGRSVEEVKKQSFFKTIASIKKIFTDPDLMNFFKEAMQ